MLQTKSCKFASALQSLERQTPIAGKKSLERTRIEKEEEQRVA
jgi:hypothetical protein